MPRNARIDIPNLLQHVIVRGIERRAIFLDDQDKEDFLDRLSQLLLETETDCYAWALLDNHFHLLLRPKKRKLGEIMRRLLTGYAVVFNRRHNRAGHLFQNRYKSIVCDEEPYLLELVRYIHLNPFRAGMVKDLTALDNFPWCGHREMLGNSPRNLLQADEVLAFFSRRQKTAREKYHLFIADGIKTGPVVKLSRGGRVPSLAMNPDIADDDCFDDRVLGGGRFVEELLGASNLIPEETQLSYTELICRVTDYFQIEPATLNYPSKERRIVRAKAVISYVAVRRLQIKGVEVAKTLGYTSAAVSLATKRGEAILAEEERLAEQLTEGKNIEI